MCQDKKVRKTVQIFYGSNTEAVVAPAVISQILSRPITEDRVFFTSQFESWKILNISLNYFCSNINTLGGARVEQSKLVYQLYGKLIGVNNVSTNYESVFVENPFYTGNNNNRWIVLNDKNPVLDFSKGFLIASGIEDLRLSVQVPTIGTGATILNFTGIISFDLESV